MNLHSPELKNFIENSEILDTKEKREELIKALIIAYKKGIFNFNSIITSPKDRAIAETLELIARRIYAETGVNVNHPKLIELLIVETIKTLSNLYEEIINFTNLKDTLQKIDITNYKNLQVPEELAEWTKKTFSLYDEAINLYKEANEIRNSIKVNLPEFNKNTARKIVEVLEEHLPTLNHRRFVETLQAFYKSFPEEYKETIGNIIKRANLLHNNKSYKNLKKHTQETLSNVLLKYYSKQLQVEDTFILLQNIWKLFPELLPYYKKLLQVTQTLTKAREKEKQAREKEEKANKLKHSLLKKNRRKFLDTIVRLLQQQQTFKELKKIFEAFKHASFILEDFLGFFYDPTFRRKFSQTNLFELIKKFSEKIDLESLKRLSELLGRMKEVEELKEKKTIEEVKVVYEMRISRPGRSEIRGITFGKELELMLPIEASLLSTPETELIFYKKFTEQKLLVLDMVDINQEEKYIKEKKEIAITTTKEKPKGPIIILIDTSGSMSGERETIAKAITLAITRTAIKEKRNVYLINFSVGAKAQKIETPVDFLDILPVFLEKGFGGGTEISEALSIALKLLQNNKYEKADVLAISDFEMGLPQEETIQAMEGQKSKETKFHALAVHNNPSREVLNLFDNHWIVAINDANSLVTITDDINISK